MKKYISYDSNGEITAVLTTEDTFVPGQNDIEIPSNSTINGDTHYVSNLEIKEYSDEGKQNKLHPPNPYATWDVQTESWKESELEHLRARLAIEKRNKLLIESDWTQLPDVPLATKEAWATYRQALRDITTQPGYPFTITWPVKPT